ncbi:uncharacterized protein LOC118905858 [Balaenoptera musculus]|uniref:Uncharacterized protein LOC118905858 n=1 Tax=Balaenoptera musculus TaxID=9771 RepID=A0A8B8Z6T0_BALMU|nr:uncharacterized protein LOC118905858 [Balaenoptera musculus]
MQLPAPGGRGEPPPLPPPEALALSVWCYHLCTSACPWDADIGWGVSPRKSPAFPGPRQGHLVSSLGLGTLQGSGAEEGWHGPGWAKLFLERVLLPVMPLWVWGARGSGRASRLWRHWAVVGLGAVGSGGGRLEGLSPAFMALWCCLIIWRGCSSSGLQPWEETPLPRDSPEGCSPTRGRACVCTLHGLQLWLDFAWPVDFPTGLPRRLGCTLGFGETWSPPVCNFLLRNQEAVFLPPSLFNCSSSSIPGFRRVRKLFLQTRVARTPVPPSLSLILHGMTWAGPCPSASQFPCALKGPLLSASALTAMWLQRDLVLGRVNVALGGPSGGSESSNIIPLGTRGKHCLPEGSSVGWKSRQAALGRGGLRAQCGNQRWMEAPGQGQAGGEGQVVFPAHAQASWPPAPGPLILRNGSRSGQVVAAGRAGVLIAPLLG